MEGTAVNTLLACMENYNEAVKKMTAKLRPGDGLLGFGRDPKRDPCHMEFYEAVGEAVGRMVQEGLNPAEAEDTVRFLVTLAQEERYFDLTQPMREAVQGHARTLVPLLEPETARELADAIDAQLVIPMHCRGEGYGLAEIDTVEPFLALSKNVEFADGPSIELPDFGAPRTVVLKLG